LPAFKTYYNVLLDGEYFGLDFLYVDCNGSLLGRSVSRCRRAYVLLLWLLFCLFFDAYISEVTERISTELGHVFIYDCYFKYLVRSTTGWGCKTYLFGTIFEL